MSVKIRRLIARITVKYLAWWWCKLLLARWRHELLAWWLYELLIRWQMALRRRSNTLLSWSWRFFFENDQFHGRRNISASTFRFFWYSLVGFETVKSWALWLVGVKDLKWELIFRCYSKVKLILDKVSTHLEIVKITQTITEGSRRKILWIKRLNV